MLVVLRGGELQDDFELRDPWLALDDPLNGGSDVRAREPRLWSVSVKALQGPVRFV